MHTKKNIHFLLLFLILTQELIAQAPAVQEYVWITPSGSRYHREDCRHARNARAILREEALKKGLIPCAVCFGTQAQEEAKTAAIRSITARVVRVADGDTVTVLEGTTQHRLRLNGIDAPESRQAYGTRSKEYLSALIFGKTVRVELIEKDRYDRWIVNIFDGSIWVNLAMVEAGYAWHYRAYSSSKELKEAEETARAARRGLWQDQNPTPPWDWRRR